MHRVTLTLYVHIRLNYWQTLVLYRERPGGNSSPGMFERGPPGRFRYSGLKEAALELRRYVGNRRRFAGQRHQAD